MIKTTNLGYRDAISALQRVTNRQWSGWPSLCPCLDAAFYAQCHVLSPNLGAAPLCLLGFCSENGSHKDMLTITNRITAQRVARGEARADSWRTRNTTI